jgi:hypothetical protein
MLKDSCFYPKTENHASETDSKVILMGHEIVKLLCPALVYSKGFFKPIYGLVMSVNNTFESFTFHIIFVDQFKLFMR